MQEITASQRASREPYMIEWVAAKDAQNRAEANAAAAGASAAQAAAAAAAEEARQIAAWKATIPTVPNGTFNPPVKATGTIPVVTTEPKNIPQSTSSQVTTTPTTASQQVTDATAAYQSRQAQKAAFTGWDNDTVLRGYQNDAWDLYIGSGSWGSSAQKDLYEKAEARRKSLNPTYKGTPWGTTDKAAADSLILPTDQFPTTNGLENIITNVLSGGANAGISSGVGLALSAGILLVVVGMFKR